MKVVLRARWVLCVSVVVLASIAAHPILAQSDGDAPLVAAPGSVSDMSFWLGTWHITETLFPGTDREYVERSIRTCTSALMGTYVLCENVSSARGRTRETLWLINQPDDGELEIVGVFSNIKARSVYRGQFLPDGSGLDLRNYELQDDVLTPGTFQRMRFSSPDEFEWRIGIRNPGTPEESVIGIEHAVRVSANAIHP